MEHVKDRLSEYLDGALGESERRKVDTHLFSCAECRAELDELKAVAKMVGKLRAKPLPAGFMDRLQKRRDLEGRAGLVPPWLAFATRSHWMRPTSVVVFAMLVMVVAFDRMSVMVSRQHSATMTAGADKLEQSKVAPGSSFSNARRKQEAASGLKLPIASASPVPAAAADNLTEQSRLAQPPALRARREAQREAMPPANAFGGGGDTEAALPPSSGYAQSAPMKGSMDLASNAALEPALKKDEADARLQAQAAVRGAAESNLRAESASRKRIAQFNEPALGGSAGAAPAAEPESPPPAQTTFVIRSKDELRRTWAQLGRADSPALIVDFDSQMVLLIRGRVKIVGVQTLNDKVVVSYRLGRPAEPIEPDPYVIVPASDKPVDFRQQ